MRKWRDIIEDQYQRAGGRYGAALKLSKKMRVLPPTLNKWLAGTEAKFDAGVKALENIGWDFDRARPDYIPTAERSEVCGRVKAGTAEFVEECKLSFDPLDNAWRRSKYAHLITPGQCYVEVDGNSMSPDYPDKSLIVCGAWNGQPLKKQTPVIARVGIDSYTFKLWSVSRGTVVLLPINTAEHEPIIATKSKPIVPYMIVLGVALVNM